jgi:hypothetical protein
MEILLSLFLLLVVGIPVSFALETFIVPAFFSWLIGQFPDEKKKRASAPKNTRP